MSTRTRLTADARRDVIEQAALEVFAERGYHGASIGEIVRRAGVSPPVLYDHFASKLELHKRLLERTRDELLAMWREQLGTDAPAAERIPRALDAWARYVQDRPYVSRMFFVETTGDPDVAEIYREVRLPARAALAAIVGRERAGDDLALEMAAEVMRSGLGGLAIWWSEHPEVPRERIVAAALDVLWTGLERVARGEGGAGVPAGPDQPIG